MGLNKDIDWKGEPSNREKMMFAVLIIGVIVVFIVRIWIPSSTSISMLKSEIQGLHEKLDKLNAGLREMESKTLSEAGVQSSEYDAAAHRLSGAPETALMSLFTDEHLGSSVSILEVSFEPLKQGAGYIEKAFKLVVQGSFFSVSEYLKGLYNAPLLIVVNDIDVKLANESTSAIIAEIKGVGYGW